MLQPHAGRRNDPGKDAVGAPRKLNQLIADAHHHGDEQQLQQHPDGRVIPADERTDDDGDKHHQEQKAGAAAGVEPPLGTHIFHRQGQPGLIAGDGLMLRPVVFKYPAHVLHPAAQPHIPHQNDDLDQALDERKPHPGAGQRL